MNNPAANAAAHAVAATTISDLLKYAGTNAAAVPTNAVTRLPVEYKIYGKVIAPSTEYGT